MARRVATHLVARTIFIIAVTGGIFVVALVERTSIVGVVVVVFLVLLGGIARASSPLRSWFGLRQKYKYRPQ